MPRPRLIALGFALTAMCNAQGVAQTAGETGSWPSSVAKPEKAKPKPKKPATPVKSEPVAPGAAPVEPLRGSREGVPKAGGGQSLGRATSVDTGGSNAPYEAFDQGRYLTALELAQKAAALGDPQAHTLIGRLYAEGFGVPRDLGLAAQWYAKASELGDIEGTFGLGVLYAQGQGVKRDYTQAARLFEAAALKGHVLANYNLALLFLKGEGKPLNPHRAYQHMRYAAEQGVVSAQYDLGTLYATGTGVDTNIFEAAKWIGKAANQGHTDAQVEYAVLLFKGLGVSADQPPDLKRAAMLFRSAAEKGVAVAQNRLARCYANGAGVETDIAEAAKWHLIAKAGGVTDETLDEIVGKLSKKERESAQRAAEEWIERSQIQ